MNELLQALENQTRKTVDTIHTACPAMITKVNYETGTVSAKPVMYYKTKLNEIYPYPEIHNIPVMFPQGNTQYAAITFPVCVGDSCLLVFAENSLDYWRRGEITHTNLKYDLSNAVCIPGLYRAAHPDFYDACIEKKVIIRAGTQSISVNQDDGIEIHGDVRIIGNLQVRNVDAEKVYSRNYVHADGAVTEDRKPYTATYTPPET